jgi:gliding motility-associated-like protein
MNRLKTIVFILATVSVFFPACKKSKDSKVEIHCQNLIHNLPVTDLGKVIVPTAFTPNGDGRNDHFKVTCLSIDRITIKIYDRNSHLVFQTDQVDGSWDYVPAIYKNEKFYYRVEAFTQLGGQIGLCGEVNSLVCLPFNANVHSYTFEDQLTPFGFTGVTGETLTSCN